MWAPVDESLNLPSSQCPNEETSSFVHDVQPSGLFSCFGWSLSTSLIDASEIHAVEECSMEMMSLVVCRLVYVGYSTGTTFLVSELPAKMIEREQTSCFPNWKDATISGSRFNTYHQIPNACRYWLLLATVREHEVARRTSNSHLLYLLGRRDPRYHTRIAVQRLGQVAISVTM